ncbi:efflux transporter outer membrane subunit [Rhizobium sp. NPDC090279]|uniref:efflux transporter outer membrane subunit n=1 Tax=Rhizobium sp. NPDC090279 TaxID=3364499 RepID=UPI00383ADAFB
MLNYRSVVGSSFLAATAALSGCVVEPAGPPVAETPKAFVGAIPNSKARDVSKDWWLAFGDSRLTSLVETGETNNPELRQAQARIEQAKAKVDLAAASLLPSVSGGVGASRGNPYGIGTSSGGYGTASGSWLVDIFGGTRAQKRAAEARYEAAVSDAEDTRLTVLSSIASTYVDVRYYQERIALAKRTVDNRKHNLSLMRDSEGAGESSQLQLVQAEQLVARAEADIPSLEVDLENSIDSLANLTGSPVAQLRSQLLASAGQPKPRYKVGVGIPADVVRNRPDVRRAEDNFVAAAENVGVAKVAFYPSLQLSGYLTPTAVVNAPNVNIWNMAANFTAPIFDGGANKANLAYANGQLQEAKGAWQAAVLNGVTDVEKALAAYDRDSRNLAAQDKLVATSGEALRLGRVNFQLGAGVFFNILDAERDYLDAQQNQAQAVRDQADHYIALCKAAPAGENDDSGVQTLSQSSSKTARKTG